MSRTAQKRTPRSSLIGQLKRCLLIVASLIAAIFIVGIPVGIVTSAARHDLDARHLALQEDQSSVQLFMFDQAADLRNYITSNSQADLMVFQGDHQHYLFAVQDLQNQAGDSDFRRTSAVLAQVEQRADNWYRNYALVEVGNMQTGKLALARADSTTAVGRGLLNQFRVPSAQLSAAIEQDITGLQARLAIPGWLTFMGIVALAAMAILVLWGTLTQFFKALRTQLKALISMANLLGSGDLSARVQELAYAELNQLGQTFNTMAEQLHTMTLVLAARSRELERTNGEISQQRDELKVLNEALEEANHARNQFLSTMSHELRTPLTAIIGFSQLLLDDEAVQQLSEQQQANLQRILKNGQHLLSLVSDVLDLEKIDAGRMEIAYEQVDARELLTSLIEEMQAMAIEHHLVLRAEIEEGVEVLESNEVKLRQILLNLVSNALKYTEQGEVLVSARRLVGADGEPDAIVFAVKDTGLGIPSEVQERVFEAFYQVQGGYTRKVGGTGLGLAITSRLTKLLGGTIDLASVPGQGSTFSVTFPLKASALQDGKQLPQLHPTRPEPVVWTSSAAKRDIGGAAPLEATTRQSGLVLAVDDNPDMIVLLRDALKETPYTVVGVQEPDRVIDLVQEMQPSAITLDVLMPEVNGWQILDQLKRNPATASIPVVMLTVISEPTVGYVLGADDYLVKPFNKQTLLNTLQRVMAAQRASSQVGQREEQPVSRRAR